MGCIPVGWKRWAVCGRNGGVQPSADCWNFNLIIGAADCSVGERSQTPLSKYERRDPFLFLPRQIVTLKFITS